MSSKGRVVEPAAEDRIVGGLSEAIGGPLGKFAVRPPYRSFWTPGYIVLAMTSLTLALHWVQKSPCMNGAWVNLKQYKNFCYTDVLALYYAEGLAEGKVPYLDHPVEYPVLTGYFMGALGLPVHALSGVLPGMNQASWFYNVNALVLSIFGALTVCAILAVRRTRPWDAALFAVAPAMFVTATVNWDLLVIVLTVGAIWAWARHWRTAAAGPIVAGVLFGLAIAAKFYPLFILGPLLLLGLRTNKFREPVLTAVTAAVTWLAVNLPVIMFAYPSWKRFFDLNWTRPVDWGTFWYIGAHLPTGGGQSGVPPFDWLARNEQIPFLNKLTMVLFVLACAAVGALILLARRRPRLGQLAFLVVALFLITNKVWSQQYVLWLVPLAVLARPRWGAFLAWQAAEVCYFFAFYGELIGASPDGKQVFPELVFVLASLARLVTLGVLVGLVVRDILHPDRDVVRASGLDDPDGGVFNGAADAPWISRLRALVGRHAPTHAPTAPKQQTRASAPA